MKIVAETGREDIATVYLAEMRPGKYVEFVQSLQPPIPRNEKWVLILSMLFGCPVGCSICDAGGWFHGKLSKEEIFLQIDYLVNRFFPDKKIPAQKFKIQFARMGEPSLNPNVLHVLKELPARYDAPGLMPSFSTIAPNGSDAFFEELLEIKNNYYGNGNFQMQFSIHTTDAKKRDELIPVNKWDFRKIAQYGKRFYRKGDRKVTLNFALAEESPLSAAVLLEYFDPDFFVIKLTPVNPTIKVIKQGITNAIKSERQANESGIVRELRDSGYDVIVSIGELEENKIGSNCGQYVKSFLDGEFKPGQEETYMYETVSSKQ
ncbi:MAG: radical SAM protein [bacterium]|nr:radical SAM protein [bacterium]